MPHQNLDLEILWPICGEIESKKGKIGRKERRKMRRKQKKRSTMYNKSGVESGVVTEDDVEKVDNKY